MLSLLNNNKVHVVKVPVVAGTTDINSDSVDMQGFENVAFLVSFGTITANAVTSLIIESSSDDGSADSFATTGVTLTVADTYSDQGVAIEIIRPLERYVRVTVDRATQNAVVNGIWAIQSCPRKMPVTHDASIAATEVGQVPARTFANS